MNSNIIAKDQVIVDATNGLYGNNRLTYLAISVGLAGNTKPYGTGNLREAKHSNVVYDVTQKFPEHAVAEAIKATSTEFKQVHATGSEFAYNQFPSAVEFTVSNMQNIPTENVEAGILRELMKQYDHQAWIGGNGNFGYWDHPKSGAKTATGSVTMASFIEEISNALDAIKLATDVPMDQLSDLTVAHNGVIGKLMRQIDGATGEPVGEVVRKAFPELTFVEYASFLSASETKGEFLMVYRPLVTFHHASAPGLFARESGKFGLSADALFTFESTTVEVEVAGAMQQVEWAADGIGALVAPAKASASAAKADK